MRADVKVASRMRFVHSASENLNLAREYEKRDANYLGDKLFIVNV